MTAASPILFEKLKRLECKQLYNMNIHIASGYKSTSPVKHMDTEVPGALCVVRSPYPYDHMKRHMENMETRVLSKVPISLSWIKQIVANDAEALKNRVGLISRVLKSTGLAGSGLHLSVESPPEPTPEPLSTLMYAKLGQHGHDKQLTFESSGYHTLEVNTPNEMTLVIGIDDNNEAALLRLFPRKKIEDVKETGFVKEVLIIFNSVSQIYYSIEDVDTREYDESYLSEFQQRLDSFETGIESSMNKRKQSPAQRSERQIYTLMVAEIQKMKIGNTHETLLMLYKNFSDMKHIPIAQYESKPTSDSSGTKSTKPPLVESNDLIVDAYTPYSAKFAADISKLNYVYVCLRSVAAALVRHYVGYNQGGISDFTWDKMNETVQEYTEHFETFKPATEQNALHAHLSNVAKMADFVTILYNQNVYVTDHNSILKTLLRSGLSYSDGTEKDHFGHILVCYFFDKAPLQVFVRPEKPQATTSEKIHYSETQKVTIIDLTEQIEHCWNPLNVEFNTRARLKSYRHCFIDELKGVFEHASYSGGYDGIVEQKDFRKKKTKGSISVRVETNQFIQTTIQQPYQILFGTTVTSKKHE